MSDNYPVDGELRRQAERIEAMEQAHAELAAKVDELDAKFDYLRNLPPYTPTGVYRILTGHAERLDSLESSAPAPDPVCQCGHSQSDHVYRGTDACDRLGCNCEAFVPTSEPAPLDNDEGMHTLPAKTAAQERYHEANERHYSNREVEMAAGAFDRAEEVAQELDDWTHLIHMRLNTLSQGISRLDPAPVFTDEQDSAIRHALSHLREAGNDRETRGLSTDRIDQSCNVLVAMLGRDGAR